MAQQEAEGMEPWVAESGGWRGGRYWRFPLAWILTSAPAGSAVLVTLQGDSIHPEVA